MEENRSYGNLLHELEPQAGELFRKLEKNQRHLIQAKNAGLFNLICINEKLLPNYSNILQYQLLSNPNQRYFYPYDSYYSINYLF